MKRYDITPSQDCTNLIFSCMEQSDDGDYVLYEDVQELLEALERMVGVCAGYLENQLPSDADLYNPNYVSPLSQARDAIKKARTG